MVTLEGGLSYQVSLRVSGGVAIVTVKGRVTAGAMSERLRATLLEYFEQGHQRLLADLAEVEYMDSAGLGELVAAYAALTRRGGALHLMRPPRRIRELLKITRLDELFVVCDDEEAGLASFGPGSQNRDRQALREFLGS
jgi:anti-sigma B factor antagonist